MPSQDPPARGSSPKLGRGLRALLGNPVQIQVPAGSLGSAQEQTVESAASAVDPKVQAPPVSPVPPTTTPSSRPVTVSNSPITEAEDQASGTSLVELSVARIVPNARQPRTDFDEASLRALAESIKQAGLMQPIMVRPRGTMFELVAGERRWRAAKLIGLATIPAIVRSLDDQAAAELALIENIQREDLNPMERAIALQKLSSDFALTHQAIADRVGLDRATVTNLLRLADLDPSTAALIRSGRLSQGHAKSLLGIADLSLRSQLTTQALKEEWSVRELERRVQQVVRGGAALKAGRVQAGESSARKANVADLERHLGEYLGTRVRLQLGRKKGSGSLTIDFYSLDQFDGLMQRIGFDAGRGTPKA